MVREAQEREEYQTEQDENQNEPINEGSNEDEEVSRETPETSEEAEEDSQTSKDGYSEDQTSEGFTEDQKGEVESFMKKMKLPKEVSYLLDKNGELKFIVPSNGQKYQVSPEELVKGWNLNQAGYQKLNEGKKIQKELKEYFQDMKENNPKKLWELADRMGIDKYSLAKELLEEAVEYEQLSDSEKRAKEIEKENERLRKENEEARKQEQSKQLQQSIAQNRERYDRELADAMKKHGFSRQSHRTKSHVLTAAVGKMMLAHQNEQEMTADDAVSLAKREWQEFVNGVYQDIDENHILDLIPENIVKAIRQADLKKLQSNEIPTSRTVTGQQIDLSGKEYQAAPAKKAKRRQPQSLQNYFESL